MLSDACYTGTYIIGTQSNYAVRFNATTGEKIDMVRVVAPAFGPMRICFLNGVCYIAMWNSPSPPYDTGFTSTHPFIDIYPLNPNTMAVGAKLGMWTKIPGPGGSYDGGNGPRCLVAANNRVQGVWMTPASQIGQNFFYIDPLNTATFDLNYSSRQGPSEQISTDGVSFWYVPSFSALEARRLDINQNPTNFVSITPHNPTATVYAPNSGKAYFLTGGEQMPRIDSWVVPKSYTALNLGTAYANVKPMRARYRSSDGLIYIPSQADGVVIKWNPNTETGTYVDGFDNPVDVVFTASKAFAVQTGLLPLKEIT